MSFFSDERGIEAIINGAIGVATFFLLLPVQLSISAILMVSSIGALYRSVTNQASRKKEKRATNNAQEILESQTAILVALYISIILIILNIPLIGGFVGSIPFLGGILTLLAAFPYVPYTGYPFVALAQLISTSSVIQALTPEMSLIDIMVYTLLNSELFALIQLADTYAGYISGTVTDLLTSENVEALFNTLKGILGGILTQAAFAQIEGKLDDIIANPANYVTSVTNNIGPLLQAMLAFNQDQIVDIILNSLTSS